MLRDQVRPPVRILLVGINPGVRSEAIGHHFAGYSNRFWKLPSRRGPRPGADRSRGRLAAAGMGTGPHESDFAVHARHRHAEADGIRRGEAVLRRKVRRWKPRIVAFVGVSLYRAVARIPAGTGIPCGLQRGRFEGARVFVVPNPSGRNANFSYAEMVVAYRRLATSSR